MNFGPGSRFGCSTIAAILIRDGPPARPAPPPITTTSSPSRRPISSADSRVIAPSRRPGWPGSNHRPWTIAWSGSAESVPTRIGLRPCPRSWSIPPMMIGPDAGPVGIGGGAGGGGIGSPSRPTRRVVSNTGSARATAGSLRTASSKPFGSAWGEGPTVSPWASPRAGTRSIS